MKDLDFDEIDRAVNSLNASTPVVGDNTQDSVKPMETLPIVPKPQSPPLAGRRSSGQFMDVVHPSSDMRRSPLMMPERPNQGASNRSNFTAPITSVPQNNTMPLTPPTAPTENNSWPDPIDFRGQKKDEVEDNEKSYSTQPEDADIDQISDDITNELSHKDDESSDSPFISGTVVDKRPLGAFSTESTIQPSEDLNQNESVDKDESSEDKKPVNNDASLPDELQDDLLHIESDDNATPAEATVLEDIPPTINTISPSVVSQPTGPTSIVQQYTEQPSSGDQKTGAIYDTNAYHKALVRPAKKKSGWLWVLWIFLLLVIGVAAGAAVYKFVLPLL